MERVAFLIEATGQRLACLLNPESLVQRRLAGVAPMRSSGGLVTGTDLRDERLLLTGGGNTELTLDLLFDVSFARPNPVVEDVRELTQPLWDLAENSSRGGNHAHPPIVRFVWGKAWNIPGIITAVAERLEYFTASGVPRRSWLRLRMRRVTETQTEVTDRVSAPKIPDDLSKQPPSTLKQQAARHEVVGNIAGSQGQSSNSMERLDDLAYKYYGDASLWRLLAWANQLDDPSAVPAGRTIDIPTATTQGPTDG